MTGGPLLVVAGIAQKEQSLLLTERLPGTHLAGHWEFPGGKIDPGETPQEALAREWKEELGVDLRDIKPATFAYHEYTEKTVLILFFYVCLVGTPSPQEGQKMAWVPQTSLNDYPMPEADKQLIEDLLTGTP